MMRCCSRICSDDSWGSGGFDGPASRAACANRAIDSAIAWAPIWVPPDMPADGKVTVHATFSQPGTYVLRSLADDGALTGYDEVTVTVTK